ncbi:MAG: M20 family metallo-hydrolase [Deltaproteobacteria bacterium]|nr:M20 family metallo-hydrolase [Deltaproteobacteria bacterium]
MLELEKVFNRIDGYRDEIISLQKELTARVALGPDNGGTGEHDKAAFLKESLKKLSPDILEEINAPDERARYGYRPNIVAIWEGQDASSRVWALSHTDIVPPGDLSLWKTDPYKATVEGDIITGRGVEDNQHGIVSSLLAMKAILECGIKPKKTVALAFVADEETGSRYGLEYLLKNRGDLFNPEDIIIVPDGGNSDGSMIEIAEKSMLWIRFTVTGKQCHASTPGEGRNSLYGAARLIVALEGLKTSFGLTDDLFAPPESTFESTKIEANVPNVNTIPGKDVFYMDCRILPRYRVDDIINEIKKITVKIEKELQLSVNVKPVHRQDSANPTPAESPVVVSLAAAIKRVKGIDARPMGIGGGTVAAFFREQDLPAAVWVTSPDTAHQPNESCPISDIISDAKVFAHVYLE